MYRKFLDPTTDITFKKVFGDKRKKDILIDFLNTITQRHNDKRIVDITMVDPNNHPEVISSKLSIVDIKCVDEEGNAYIVEMQVINQAGYLERCQYYTCLEVARQLDRKDLYKKLTPVIFIGIANFILFDNPSYLNHHLILNTHTKKNELTLMEFHFLELEKFTKDLSALDSVIDQWTYFLKNAETLDEIPDELKENEAIVRAFEVLEQAHFTRAELAQYDALIDQYRVEIGRKEAALEEGLKKGLEKGLEQGLEKGRYEKSLEIAKNLLHHGMDIKEVSKATGLSIEILKKL